MSKDNLVRYHNTMNDLAFGKFKEKELDLFFSICFKLKLEGTKELTLGFAELKELSQYETTHLSRFIKDLDSTYRKMLSLHIKIVEDELNFTYFNLFSKYTISNTNKTVSIKLNEDFRHMFNELTGNYTKFELIDFVSLKSSYSKNIFKLLKQWGSVGIFEIEIEEFKRVLDIPSSYRMSDINKRVLVPIMEELPQHFLNLKLKKIKNGKSITKLKFSWVRNGVALIPEKKEENSTTGEDISSRNINKFDEDTADVVFPWEVDEEKKNNATPSIENKSKKKIDVAHGEQRRFMTKVTEEQFHDILLKKLNIIDIKKVPRGLLKVTKDILLKEYEIIVDNKDKKSTIEFSEISKDLILGKSGKPLVGGALKMRLQKIAKELEKNIQLDNGTIILA